MFPVAAVGIRLVLCMFTVHYRHCRPRPTVVSGEGTLETDELLITKEYQQIKNFRLGQIFVPWKVKNIKTVALPSVFPSSYLSVFSDGATEIYYHISFDHFCDLSRG